MKIIISALSLFILIACSNSTQNKSFTFDPKIGEYFYLDLEEGAICHIDANCGKNSTYIRADFVLSEVKKCKESNDYHRTGNAAYDVIYGNFHFCSKCIPLAIMKEIEEKTRPLKE